MDATLPASLPHQEALQTKEGPALQDLFTLQARALQEVAQGLLSAVGRDDASKTAAAAFMLLNDYISKACALAAKLGILEALACGNEASSAPIRVAPAAAAPEIPVSTVFARINEAFRAAEVTAGLGEDDSIAAVEQALRHLEVAAAVGAADSGPRPASPLEMPQVFEGSQLQEGRVMRVVEMEEVVSAEQ